MAVDFRLHIDIKPGKVKVPGLGHYVSVQILLLLLIESIAFALAYAFVMSVESSAGLAQQLLRADPYTYSLLMVVGCATQGLYRVHNDHSLRATYLKIGLSFGLGALLILMALSVSPPPTLPLNKTVVVYAHPLAFVLAIAIHSFHLHLIKRSAFKKRVLVLGAGNRASCLSELQSDTDLSAATIVGYVQCGRETNGVPPSRVVDIDLDELEAYTRQNAIDEILFAPDDRRIGLPMRQLLACKMHGVNVVDLSSFLERETGKIRLDLIYPSTLIFSDGFDQSATRQFVGRFMDVCGSLVLLLVLSPVMVLAAGAILLDGQKGGCVIYRQRRVGLQGKVFEIFKFRTMVIGAEKKGSAQWAEKEDARVTTVGRFLRKYRIDELPQLFNVLKGDMSLVGPRPERPEFVQELRRNIPYYEERHRVKPGITGWAQINYPYGSSEKDALEKLQYDLYYVKNNSVLFDVAVLLQTEEVIFFRKGAR